MADQKWSSKVPSTLVRFLLFCPSHSPRSLYMYMCVCMLISKPVHKFPTSHQNTVRQSHKQQLDVEIYKLRIVYKTLNVINLQNTLFIQTRNFSDTFQRCHGIINMIRKSQSPREWRFASCKELIFTGLLNYSRFSLSITCLESGHRGFTLK